MICETCQKEVGERWSKTYFETNTETEKRTQVYICTSCGTGKGVPDVYFDKPYHDEHLADAEHIDGRYIYSKRQKAQVLKEMNLREAGDRVRGKRTKYEGPEYGIKQGGA